ncbi:hypothetical protein [Fusobacterium sp.]|uniref:hypothetical protein n=1 Tax=Fusobacterium sp. TaxID=68766 RepID=UPI002904BDEE|nr:hypothetical protein [Fusobacterium sp.]MDU1912530.1 hypothetical protein [Fusobacterium sp.]
MLNIKEITAEDLKRIYGEEYKTVDEIAEDFALYERDTLEEAVFELFDDENLRFILELIAKGEINEYIEEHIAKYQGGYLINFNEYF